VPARQRKDRRRGGLEQSFEREPAAGVPEVFGGEPCATLRATPHGPRRPRGHATQTRDLSLASKCRFALEARVSGTDLGPTWRNVWRAGSCSTSAQVSTVKSPDSPAIRSTFSPKSLCRRVSRYVTGAMRAKSARYVRQGA